MKSNNPKWKPKMYEVIWHVDVDGLRNKIKTKVIAENKEHANQIFLDCLLSRLAIDDTKEIEDEKVHTKSQ